MKCSFGAGYTAAPAKRVMLQRCSDMFREKELDTHEKALEIMRQLVVFESLCTLWLNSRGMLASTATEYR